VGGLRQGPGATRTKGEVGVKEIGSGTIRRRTGWGWECQENIWKGELKDHDGRRQAMLKKGTGKKKQKRTIKTSDIKDCSGSLNGDTVSRSRAVGWKQAKANNLGDSRI